MTKKKDQQPATGSWIFREIPRDLMQRARIAAAVDGTSIKGLILGALQARLDEMEKKGILPKGK
jgi:hypothetical protein